jgi:hypothetical protein
VSASVAHELAEKVLTALGDDAPTLRYGEELEKLVLADRQLHHWLQERVWRSLGQLVISVRKQRDERDVEVPTIRYDGRPMTKTIKVNGQLRLWYEVTPAQWCAAVFREQQVVDGRQESNAVRLELVRLLDGRPDLMGLPTIEAVLTTLGLPLDGYNLPVEADA